MSALPATAAANQPLLLQIIKDSANSIGGAFAVTDHHTANETFTAASVYLAIAHPKISLAHKLRNDSGESTGAF